MPVDAFLEIYDSGNKMIEGESKDDKHKKKLQIRNFSFGTEMQHSSTTGTGLGAGKVDLKVFEFEVANSKASPILFRYSCTGEHCQKAKLFVRKAGGKARDYYIWTFSELLIIKFELSCSEDITEKVAFAYTKIECDYRQQDEKGAVSESGVTAWYDLKLNKADA